MAPAPLPGAALLGERWLAAAAAGDRSALLRRLSWDAWDYPAVISALARSDPPEDASPGWASWLELAIEQAPTVAAEFTGQTGLDEEAIGSGEEPIPFLELWVPFLRGARELLDAVAGKVLQRFSASARRDLERGLLKDLAARGAACAYESFDRWRRTPRASAAKEPSEPRGRQLYTAFVHSCLAGGLGDLCLGYPALARCLATFTANWVDVVTELAERLDRDSSFLGSELADGDELEQVVEVATHVSEAHGGGRRVMVLTFSSGHKLVYKPRPMDMEAALQGLLGWLNEQQFDLTPPISKCVASAGYGWSIWLEPAAARSLAQVERYFERAGALLCLVELLGAGDLHAENVVAAAAGPALIDAETLLQPRNEEAWTSVGQRLRSQLATSPQLDAAGRIYDFGGLRGNAPRLAEADRAFWQATNTDDMAIEYRPAFTGPGPNVLYYRGRPCTPEAHTGSIARGFRAAYLFLLHHRRVLLAAGGPLARFRSCSCRVLLRPSQHYATLVALLRRPQFQRSGIHCDLLLERTNRAFASDRSRPSGWDLIARERRALLDGDIPRFEMRADGTEVELSTGRMVPGCFLLSGFQVARQQFEQMSEKDLASWLRAIQLLRIRSAPCPPAAVAFNPVDQAVALGQRLLERRSPEQLRGEWGFYGGHLGLAVFTAALARQTGDPHLRARATAQVYAVLTQPLPRRQRAGVDLGTFIGLGGELYGASLVASWLDDPGLVEAAFERLRRLDRREFHHVDLDLSAGLAGFVLGALALAETTGDSTAWEAALHAGTCLAVRLEERPLITPGVAHGYAGVALALFRLAAKSGGRSWLQPAHRAWEREWQVRAATPGFTPSLARHGQGWCRGSAGIGLVALEMARAEPDTDRPLEISTAISIVREASMADFDDLCCGAAGELELLLQAHRMRALPGRRNPLDLFRAAWWQRLAARGPQFFHDRPGQNRPRAGLFRGLAGVGYQLLRSSQPDRWPSILTLESATEEKPCA